MPKKNSEKKPVEVCNICSLSLFDKNTMIIHLLGKKHRKKAKDRYLKESTPRNRSIRILGLNDMYSQAEKVLSNFHPYGIVDCHFMKKSAIIELATEEEAKKAVKTNQLVKGIKLDVSLYTPDPRSDVRKKAQPDIKMPPLSQSLQTRLIKKSDNPNFIDGIIVTLMTEIELKHFDQRNREELRSIVENFLSATFPNCEGFIFGSSANNLGFSGCDVDMVANLKVPIWEGRSKADGENEAALMTRYIAKEIRLRNLGYKVVPISRARVPIIKFVDCYYHLQVDLSFKNGMPIHNTRLIKQYTHTHPIVRPYLMLLRYWAKSQMIAGGGQPDTLLTNYCFCMLMLFWLMAREQPIVPCVGELQENYKRRPIYIDGWNCSFSEPQSKWTNAFHEIHILELALEFFEFYSNLESTEWVISPLQGSLIPKEDIINLKPSFSQPYLKSFYSNRLSLQLKTPLCVQDPFEICHNIARGFKEPSMANFQAKCRIAVDICKNIKEGKAALHELFEAYKVENIKKYLTSSMPNVKDMVVVDSSDEDSKDSVELKHELESLERMGGLKRLFSGSNEKINQTETNSFMAEDMKSVQDENEIVEIIEERHKMDESSNQTEINLIQDENEVLEIVDVNQKLDGIIKSSEEVKLADTSDEVLFLTEVDKHLKEPKEIVTLDDSLTEIAFSSGPNKIEGDEFGFITNSKDESKNEEVVFLDSKHTNIKDTGHLQTPSTSIGLSSTPPNNEESNFDFNFSCSRNFMVTSEGNINFQVQGLSKENCIINLWKFILKYILKCEIFEEEEIIISEETTAKRKSFDSHNELSAKFLKTTEGESFSVDKRFEKINKLLCNMPFNIFHGRKVLSKELSSRALSPLQFEVAVSNLIESKYKELMVNLKFEAVLWKETVEINKYWVTFNFDNKYKGNSAHITSRLPLFCQNIMRHAHVFLMVGV